MHRANSVRHTECPSSSHQSTAATNSSQHQCLDRSNRPQTQPASGEDNRVGRACGSSCFVDQATNKPTTKSKEATRNSSSQQRQLQANLEQQVYLKSCLSDGDFNEILIKVNDHQDVESEKSSQFHQKSPDLSPSFPDQNRETAGLDCELDKTRRRSSCSDAEDSKANL